MPERRRSRISRVKAKGSREARDPNQERIKTLIRAIGLGKVAAAEKVSDVLTREILQSVGKTDFAILADLLNSADEQTRIAAAACIDYQARQYVESADSALGIVLRERLDMPQLFDALRDENQRLEVRRHLLRALPILRFGSENDSLPVVLELLDCSSPPDLLEAAIDALQWCGSDLASAATTRLSELLDHVNTDARMRACETLERLGRDGKPAIPALVECACDDTEPRVRLQAAAALVAIDPADNELVPMLTRDQREKVVGELRKLGAPGRALRQRLEARRTAWMSTRKLAEELGVKPRTVQRHIKSGTLVPLQSTGNTTNSKYQIDLDELEQLKRERGS